MKEIKKLIRKIKDWLIGKLGGYTKEELGVFYSYTKEEVGVLYKSQIEVQRKTMQAWADTVQELCRRSDNTYYDWACEYCAQTCDKRNSWCERFMPEPVNGLPHIDINALKQRQQNNE